LFLGEMGCKEEISRVGVRITDCIEVERINWIACLGMHVLSAKDCSAAIRVCLVAISSARG
jgi:hypothetical protein